MSLKYKYIMNMWQALNSPEELQHKANELWTKQYALNVSTHPCSASRRSIGSQQTCSDGTFPIFTHGCLLIYVLQKVICSWNHTVHKKYLIEISLPCEPAELRLTPRSLVHHLYCKLGATGGQQWSYMGMRLSLTNQYRKRSSSSWEMLQVCREAQNCTLLA